jgi:hypothetical protein
MSGQNARKRELITRILKEHPELTDRAIAKKAAIEIGSHLENVSHPLVAAVREDESKGRSFPTSIRLSALKPMAGEAAVQRSAACYIIEIPFCAGCLMVGPDHS